MTNEEALKEALLYVADGLERNEVYQIQTDSFVRREAIQPLLADFARKVGSGRQLDKWREWCERRRK